MTIGEGVPNLQTYDIVLAAGAVYTLAAQGRFFAILESPEGAVEIQIDGGPTAVLSRGLQYFMPEGRFFESLTILNPASVATTIKLAVGNGDLRDNRSVESGPVSVTGTLGVIGQPLTDDGGSISPLGTSFFLASITNNGLPLSTVTVFTAATNANGVFIRLAQYILQQKDLGGPTTNVGNYREIASTDALMFASWELDIVFAPHEIFVPPGIGVEFVAPGNTAVVGMMRYTIL